MLQYICDIEKGLIMTNKDNYEKLFTRLTKILERLYNGEELSVSQLAEDYDTSKRTIQRDFAERLLLNFPIEKIGTKWKMSDGHRLGRTNVHSEVIVLELMENMARNLGTEIFSKGKTLLSKLKNDDESAFYTKLLFEDTSNMFKDFEVLERAIKKSHIVSFLHDGKTKTLKPYRILNLDGYWYICGVNVKTNRLTNMRISRMSLITETEEPFEKIQEIDDKVKSAITGNFKPSRALQEVELLIEDNPKFFLKQIPISPTLKVIEISDSEGWIHVSLQVTDLNEIIPYIKRNIPRVFVLSPEKLRDKVIEQINEYLKECKKYMV
jgi:predicted DNA-binding transcriptional regulator YafY